MTRRAVIVAQTVSAVNIPLAVAFLLLGANIAAYLTLMLGTACIWGIACGVIVL